MLAFFVFTRVLLYTRKDGAMKGPGWTKSTKAILKPEQWPPTSHPFSLPPINEIRCSLSSPRGKARLYCWNNDSRSTRRVRKTRHQALFAYRVALINSAKFTPPTTQIKRNETCAPYFLSRAEFSPWAKAWRQSFTKPIESAISGSAAAVIMRLGSEEEICLNVSGERPRLCEAFSTRISESVRKKERERTGIARKARARARALVRNIAEYGFNAARRKSNYVIRSHKGDTRVETFAKPSRKPNAWPEYTPGLHRPVRSIATVFFFFFLMVSAADRVTQLRLKISLFFLAI